MSTNKVRLTEWSVGSRPPGLTWDAVQRWLALRVQPTGGRSYYCVYSQNGRPRWLRLGDASILSLADARRMTAAAVAIAAQGGDPSSAKKQTVASYIADKWRRLAKQGVEPACFLYRHFNADGDLLYVGMTLYVMGRQKLHLKDATWGNSIYQIVIEPFASREELVEAERRAIKTEFPKHNRIHNDRTLRRELVVSGPPLTDS